jgi:RIO kinase 1
MSDLSSLGQMTSDYRQSNADVQRDDAPENPSNALLGDPRQGGYFIDDETSLEWTEESADEEDEDEIDEGYDDNRVEDEDWEVAEGGMLTMNELLGI